MTKKQEQHNLRRFSFLENRLQEYKVLLGKRLLETKRIFGRKLVTVDPHTHSTFSDGRGTVKENLFVAKACGLDFVFITDHSGIAQKRVVKNLPNASWGQEPGSLIHHICMLHNPKKLILKGNNLAVDFKYASENSDLAFIPHPGGLFQAPENIDERIKPLRALGESFSMEVMNGLYQIFGSNRTCDQASIVILDQLLSAGHKINVLGASDAHDPFGIGTAWSGVLGAKCEASSIIKAIKKGRCFASESSLLEFFCNDKPMGSTICCDRGELLTFRCRVADSFGLDSVRVVSNGKIIRHQKINDKKLYECEFSYKAPSTNTYYRLETTAKDDRRAFSTSIYIKN